MFTEDAAYRQQTKCTNPNSFKRWFPKIGVPPNHPFIVGIFHYKPSTIGYPHFGKPPNHWNLEFNSIQWGTGWRSGLAEWLAAKHMCADQCEKMWFYVYIYICLYVLHIYIYIHICRHTYVCILPSTYNICHLCIHAFIECSIIYIYIHICHTHMCMYLLCIYL